MDASALRDDLRSWIQTQNQTEVARLSGISRTWLNKFARGVFNNPTTARLDQLARARSAIHGTSESHRSTQV
jgi:transcriptional regulator with XRE-family HTH domain